MPSPTRRPMPGSCRRHGSWGSSDSAVGSGRAADTVALGEAACPRLGRGALTSGRGRRGFAAAGSVAGRSGPRLAGARLTGRLPRESRLLRAARWGARPTGRSCRGRSREGRSQLPGEEHEAWRRRTQGTGHRLAAWARPRVEEDDVRLGIPGEKTEGKNNQGHYSHFIYCFLI